MQVPNAGFQQNDRRPTSSRLKEGRGLLGDGEGWKRGRREVMKGEVRMPSCKVAAVETACI